MARLLTAPRPSPSWARIGSPMRVSVVPGMHTGNRATGGGRHACRSAGVLPARDRGHGQRSPRVDPQGRAAVRLHLRPAGRASPDGQVQVIPGAAGMGGRRRPEGDRGPLTGYFDLRGYAEVFAGELSDLLNHTVTDGIRIAAVTDKDARQARVGYGCTAKDLGAFKMIPLSIRKSPKLYLGMLFKIAPDDAGRYPMVRSSVMFLSPDDDPAGRVL